MNTVLYYFLTLIPAYCIGSVPFGLLLGKMRGIDIREHGSKNIGATNVTRTLGKKWGIFCFFLDACKGAIPVLIAKWLVTEFGFPLEIPVYTAMATVLGHIFPVYLKFKGGKGVSTIFGGLLALTPLPVLAAGVSWLIIFGLFRYVSLASIFMTVMMPLSAWFLPQFFPEYCHVSNLEMTLLIMMGAVSIFKHRANLARLFKGNELRFEKPKKESKNG